MHDYQKLRNEGLGYTCKLPRPAEVINEGKRHLEWMVEEGDGHQLQFSEQSQHEMM